MGRPSPAGVRQVSARAGTNYFNDYFEEVGWGLADPSESREQCDETAQHAGCYDSGACGSAEQGGMGNAA